MSRVLLQRHAASSLIALNYSFWRQYQQVLCFQQHSDLLQHAGGFGAGEVSKSPTGEVSICVSPPRFLQGSKQGCELGGEASSANPLRRMRWRGVWHAKLFLHNCFDKEQRLYAAQQHPWHVKLLHEVTDRCTAGHCLSRPCFPCHTTAK